MVRPSKKPSAKNPFSWGPMGLDARGSGKFQTDKGAR
jgi:hypothetical protein